MGRKQAPEVNAGSMADIAFLLLIFFLVTTTVETDSGINRQLPPIEPPEEDVIIKQKNIFTVVVNRNDQLLVEEKLMELKDVTAAAMAFIDNGAGVGAEACNYCQGAKDPASSDNPTKAIISLQNDRQTSYKTYISVQNELVRAYNELRDREYRRKFPNDGMTFIEASDKYSDPKTNDATKEKLKEKLEEIKLLIPQKLSEAEPKKNN
jgi:hypothetical protein